MALRFSTPANTVFVPVKTGVSSGFEINAFNGGTGTALYSLSTDYIAPSSQWIVPYQPVLATNSVETRLYYPGPGGTIYYIDNVDSASHGTPVQQVFLRPHELPNTARPDSVTPYSSTLPSRPTAAATYFSVFESRARRRRR